jgi:NADPH-dependent F420 reductase
MSAAADKRVAILGGTGQLGHGLALRWALAGYAVTIGSRNPDKAAQSAAQVNELAAAQRAAGCSYRDAAAAAPVVVLSVPYAAQQATADEVRDLLEGKILIDTTVPLVPPKVARVQLPAGGSAVAALQTSLGAAVKVVSAFQNVPASALGDPSQTVDCDVLVCGDDVPARETVIAMIADMGIRALHAGPVVNSAATEAMTSLLISINSRYKTHAGIRVTGLPDQ